MERMETLKRCWFGRGLAGKACFGRTWSLPGNKGVTLLLSSFAVSYTFKWKSLRSLKSTHFSIFLCSSHWRRLWHEFTDHSLIPQRRSSELIRCRLFSLAPKPQSCFLTFSEFGMCKVIKEGGNVPFCLPAEAHAWSFICIGCPRQSVSMQRKYVASNPWGPVQSVHLHSRVNPLMTFNISPT